MRKILFAFSVLALGFTSCDKNDDDSDVTPENLAGTYKIQSLTVQMGTGGPVMDVYAQMDACQKDDTWTLNASGTFVYADAGTKCNPPGDYNGTWSLPSTTSIIIDGETYTIASFDGDKLSLTATETTQGVTTTANMTLDKQ